MLVPGFLCRRSTVTRSSLILASSSSRSSGGCMQIYVEQALVLMPAVAVVFVIARSFSMLLIAS